MLPLLLHFIILYALKLFVPWFSKTVSLKSVMGTIIKNNCVHLCKVCIFMQMKVGKTTRPFRYDLNQIPYDYIVEVRNRFKGLDLIDRVPDELWMEVPDIVQETGIKMIPNKKKCKKAKCWGGLTNSCERKKNEKQRRKGKI